MASKAAEIRRKDLRRPDEFITITTRALAYARDNSRTLSWVAGGVIALAVVGIALNSFRGVQEERANTEFSRGLSAYSTEHYGDASTLFQDFVRRWGSTRTSPMAQLYAGRSALGLGKYDEAAAAMERAATELTEDYLRQQALLGWGYALEGQKDYTKATERFAEATRLVGPNKAPAILGEARTRALSGDTAGARAAYDRFLSEFPDAPEKAFVESQRDRLG